MFDFGDKSIVGRFLYRTVHTLDTHAILVPMEVCVPVVLGTGRDERKSERIARFVHERLEEKEGVTAPFIDVREYVQSTHTIAAWVDDARAHPWREVAQKAAGFVFVVPEYNHGYPGEFKLLLDSAYNEYADKPAVLVGVSSGTYGGVRVIDHLMPIVHELRMHVVGTTVATSNVEKLFAHEQPVDEKYAAFVDTALTELLTHIKN